MNDDRQERLLRGKVTLDKCISRISKLAEEAADASVECCGTNDLDQRDDLGDLSADLTMALGHLRRARARAGRIDGGGMTRGGGT